MIVLDTNIVAAIMGNGAEIDPWLATVARHELYTTVMTRAEIRYGLSRLPTGRRPSRLRTKLTVYSVRPRSACCLSMPRLRIAMVNPLRRASLLADHSRSPTQSSPALLGFIAPRSRQETAVTSKRAGCTL